MASIKQEVDSSTQIVASVSVNGSPAHDEWTPVNGQSGNGQVFPRVSFDRSPMTVERSPLSSEGPPRKIVRMEMTNGNGGQK